MKRCFFTIVCVLSIFLSFLIACRSTTKKSEEMLSGLWAIDTISLLNENVMSSLSHNLIAFEDGDKCTLPQFDWQGATEGSWRVYMKEGKINLDIKSTKSTFNRNYEITFFDDEKRKLHCMTMESDSMLIICSKGLTAYKK